MGRKKSELKTSLIRVSVTFSERVKHAARARGMTMAEFCDACLMPCVDEAHRIFIRAEAAKLDEGGE